MDIMWNEDTSNPTEVLIITEWNGAKMDGTSSNAMVTHHTIVDDNGACTLDDSMFSGMPDGALVNIWLIRANVVTVYYDGPLTLNETKEIVQNNPTTMTEFLHDNREFLYNLQTTTLVYGAVTHLPIYLIRNTVNPVPARE